MEAHAERRQNIRQTMESKDTEELLEIWRRNDREVWTAAALEVVEVILRDRLGELPAQEARPRETEADTYFNLNRAVSVAQQAAGFANLVLIAAIAFFIALIISALRAAADSIGAFVLNFVFNFALLVILAGTFLLLRGVAQVIHLLMDIQAHVRPK